MPVEYNPGARELSTFILPSLPSLGELPGSAVDDIVKICETGKIHNTISIKQLRFLSRFFREGANACSAIIVLRLVTKKSGRGGQPHVRNLVKTSY